MINFKTGKEPKMNMFDFWAFQKQMHMPSRAKYILRILFGAFEMPHFKKPPVEIIARLVIHVVILIFVGKSPTTHCHKNGPSLLVRA